MQITDNQISDSIEDSVDSVFLRDTLPKATYKLETEESERLAIHGRRPGFHFRPPPLPHLLSNYYTSDDELFETIHMGAALVDASRWTLVVTGLVQHPFFISLDQLKQYPRTTITAFHECYGSPLQPPTKPVRRIGNVTWTGVRLRVLLALAGGPLPAARYVWSDGLDAGTFGGLTMDRYQKDLPLDKALADEVLLAWEMNGAPLRVERGGPVRLVVPGWFGTNSTKWVCRLTLREMRSPSPFTTKWYNEIDPTVSGGKRPVWSVEPNSIIVEPPPGFQTFEAQIVVRGWAWSDNGIEAVAVSADGGVTWQAAQVEARKQFSWQAFHSVLAVERDTGLCSIVARATDSSGHRQPLTGRRNECPSVNVQIL